MIDKNRSADAIADGECEIVSAVETISDWLDDVLKNCKVDNLNLHNISNFVPDNSTNINDIEVKISAELACVSIIEHIGFVITRMAKQQTAKLYATLENIKQLRSMI